MTKTKSKLSIKEIEELEKKIEYKSKELKKEMIEIQKDLFQMEKRLLSSQKKYEMLEGMLELFRQHKTELGAF